MTVGLKKVNYKTLGTIVYELTGVIAPIEITQKLGLVLKDYCVEGYYIYVDEPVRDQNRIITTRAYDPEGQKIVRELLQRFIREQREKESYNYLKSYVKSRMEDDDEIPF